MIALSYFEMPEEEVPDESIWHHPTRLEEWFAAVKQKREKGYEAVPDPGTADEEEDMTGNELVKEALGL